MVRNTYEVQNVGDLLREKRKQLGMNIKDVATTTKIRTEYLLALESGNYNKFASGVYAKGFLKKYAKFLGISPDRAAAMYRREQKKSPDSNLTSTDYLRNRFNTPNFELNQGRAIAIGIAVLLIGFLYYIFSQISVVLEEPTLFLTEPARVEAGQEQTYPTTEEQIDLRGEVELGSSLTLNGNEVNVNNLETFEISDLNLEIGRNRFDLVATSQFGQQTELSLIVVRNQPIAESPVNSETTIVAEISVQDSSTTFQGVLDNQNYIESLEPGESIILEADNEFSISTRNPGNISLVVNDTEYRIDNTSEYTFTIGDNGQILFSN